MSLSQRIDIYSSQHVQFANREILRMHLNIMPHEPVECLTMLSPVETGFVWTKFSRDLTAISAQWQFRPQKMRVSIRRCD